MKAIIFVLSLIICIPALNKAQIKVEAQIDHLIPDGLDSNGYIIPEVTVGNPPYIYSWINDFYPTGKDLNPVLKGSYRFSIKDNTNAFIYKTYRIGYRAIWDQFNGLAFTEGNFTVQNGGVPGFPSAFCKNILRKNTNGWIEFVVSQLDVEYYTGFTQNPNFNNGDPNDYQFALKIGQDNSLFALTGNNTYTFLNFIDKGDVITVEKIDNEIIVSKDNIEVFRYNYVFTEDLFVKTLTETNLQLNLGCSFADSNSPDPLKIFPKISHIKMDDPAVPGKIVPVVSGGNSPYSYQWNESSTNGKDVTSLNSGNFSLLVTDNNSNSIGYNYSIGYNVYWRDLKNAVIRNDSLLPIVTTEMVQAISVNKIASNSTGWLQFVVPTLNNAITIGLLDEPSAQSFQNSDIDFGCTISSGYNMIIMASGTQVATAVVEPGDVLKIGRDGANFYISKNGTNIHTRLAIQAGLYAKTILNGFGVSNLGMSFPRKLEVSLQQQDPIDEASQGFVQLIPKFGKPPYRIKWASTSSAYGELSMSLDKGIYNVIVRDSLMDTVKLNINVGGLLKWVNIDNMVPNSDGVFEIVDKNKPGLASASRYLITSQADSYYKLTVDNKDSRYNFILAPYDSASGQSKMPPVKMLEKEIVVVKSSLPSVGSAEYNKLDIVDPSYSSESVLLVERSLISDTCVSCERLHYNGIQINYGKLFVFQDGYTRNKGIDLVNSDELKVSVGSSLEILKNNVSVQSFAYSGPTILLGIATFEGPIGPRGQKGPIVSSIEATGTVNNNPSNNNPTEGCAPCSSDNQRNFTDSEIYNDLYQVVSSQRTYYDDQGKILQIQTKNLTESKIIVVEYMYDFNGRNIGVTLPAPIDQQCFCYKVRFVESYPGYSYDASYYDTPNHTAYDWQLVPGERDAPVGVHPGTAYTLGWYYSDNNTLEKYTPKTTIPYSRIQYSNVDESSIYKVSKAGYNLYSGSGHEIYTFKMGTMGELNHMFGFANGWRVKDVSSYAGSCSFGVTPIGLTDKSPLTLKTISVDENGIENIAFSDMSGNIIATCLAGQENGADVKTQIVKGYISFNDESRRYIDVHIPQGCENSLSISQPMLAYPSLSIQNFKFNIINLKTGELIKFGSSYDVSGSLNSSISPVLTAGYYRIFLKSVLNASNLPQGSVVITGVEVTSKLNYYNFNLNYYDYANRLKSVVAPKGQNIGSNGSSSPTWFNKVSKVQVVTTSANAPDFFPPNRSWSLVSGSFSNIISLDLPNTQANTTKNIQLRLTVSNKEAPLSGIPSGVTSDDLRTTAVTTGWADYHFPESLIDTVGRSFVLPPDSILSLIYNVPFRVKVGLLNASNVLIEDYVKEKFINCRIYLTSDNRQLKVWDTETFDFDTQFSNTGVEAAAPVWSGIKILELEPTAQAGLTDTDYENLSKDLIFSLRGTSGVSNGGTGGGTGNTMAEYYTYNSWSQLHSHISADEGKSDFVYTTRGEVKFTRNEKQNEYDLNVTKKQFNYNSYEYFGRLIHNGQYTPPTSGNLIYFFRNYDEWYTYRTSNTGTYNGETGGYCVNNFSDDYVPGVFLTYIQDDVDYHYDTPDPQFSTQVPSAIATSLIQHHLNGRISSSKSKTKKTFYSYDEVGRLEWVAQIYFGVNAAGPNQDIVKTFRYVYDLGGQLAEIQYNKESSIDGLTQFLEYDMDSRLKRVSTKRQATLPATTQKMIQATYSYYLHGPLKRVELGDKLQGMDYIYTVNGWLKGVNSGNASMADDPGEDGTLSYTKARKCYPDLFGYNLDYFYKDYERSGTNVSSYNENPATYQFASNLYDGHIQAQRWQTRATSAISSNLSYNGSLMYGYNYDKKYQLTTARFAPVTDKGALNVNSYGGSTDMVIGNTGDYKVYDLTYDLNGNILTLKRDAYTASPSGLNVDNLSYAYLACSNKLSKVTDAVTTNPYNTLGFKPGQANNNYTYNGYGELVSENNDNKKYEYNSLGNISTVKDQSNNLVASYYYDEMGYRIRKVIYLASNTREEYLYIRDVSGSEIASFKKIITSSANPNYSSPADWNIDGGGSRIGVIDNTNNIETYLYSLSDQIGNTRVAFRKKNKTVISNNFDVGATNDDSWFTVENSNLLINGGSSTNYYVRTNKSTGREYGPGAKMIPVKNGDNITLAWKALAAGATGVLAGMEVQLTDENGNKLGNPIQYYPIPTNQVINTWVNFSQTFNITANYPTMYLSFYPHNKDNTSKAADFDDFVFTFNSGAASEPEILNVASYYPHGSVMPGLNYNSSYSYKYGYQGLFAEKDNETNETFFDLRNYDPLLARFKTPDPYGQFWSPYLAMGNSHPNTIDPDGGDAYTALVGAGIGAVVGTAAALTIDYAKDGELNQSAGFYLAWGIGGAATGAAVAGFGWDKPTSGRYLNTGIFDGWEPNFKGGSSGQPGVALEKINKGNVDVLTAGGPPIVVPLSALRPLGFAGYLAYIGISMYSIGYNMGTNIEHSSEVAAKILITFGVSEESLMGPQTYDFAHGKKKQSTGKSGSDKHDAGYTHGGKTKFKNPNKRKNADDRRYKGKRIN